MPDFDKRYAAPGAPPGTLAAHPERNVDEVSVTLTDFGPEFLEERTIGELSDLAGYLGRDSVTWIDVVGLHDLAPLQTLGEMFGLHALALEDVLNTGQRPKVQEFEDHLFIVLKLPSLGERLSMEQVNVFAGEGWVITLRERPGPVFDPVRERLLQGSSKIRDRDSAYLAYALVDALVDRYFPLLETVGDRIEELQDMLVENPERRLLEAVQHLKSDLLSLRHAAWPQREVFDRLNRREFQLVSGEVRVFFQDCYDHTIQILDTVEYYREMAGGMVELYLTSLSNRTNEIMKVLTLMASVFIPLTFIAGVYGMNFSPAAGAWSMPELNSPWGYPAVWVVMLSSAFGMWLFFRRKGWL
ncbi:MAG: magnesium/cobalt transporter CorA [Thermoanaerobaculia bacterium]